MGFGQINSQSQLRDSWHKHPLIGNQSSPDVKPKHLADPMVCGYSSDPAGLKLVNVHTNNYNWLGALNASPVF